MIESAICRALLGSCLVIALLGVAGGGHAQDQQTAFLEASEDIGSVRAGGSSERLAGSVTVSGSGADIWTERDAFHFAFGSASGDFALTARLASFDGPTDWGKAGLMVRSSASPDADNVAILATVGGRVMTQYRDIVGGATTSVGRDPTSPERWLRIIRRGNHVETRYSSNGTRWHTLRDVVHLFPRSVVVGLAVTSHADGEVATAVFEHVSFTRDLASLVEPVQTQDSDHLHVTAEELAIWRERAANGPYRERGDASTNSPADWQRIVSRADEFLEDPAWRHWRGNTGSSCYERGDPAPHDEPATNIMNAAFAYLVTEDTRYRNAARAELLSLASEPGLDFGDTSKWCLGEIGDVGPGLDIANWFTMLLFAYDYLGEASFDAVEHERLASWFLEAARYFQREVDHDLAINFPGRLEDDYELSDRGWAYNEQGCTITHFDGWTACSLARFYNNRRAVAVRFFALTGIKFGDELLQDRAKRFVREWMTYSVYPDGTVGEFERWTERLPDLGWDYGAVTTGSIVTIADAFARRGDYELYEFTTADGLFGSASEPGNEKSLLKAIRNVQNHLLPDFHRYATRNANDVGDSSRRIDGKHPPLDWYSAADVVLVPANHYYEDEKIRAIYLRTAQGVDGYPEEVAPRGPDVPWTGEWGIYPGVLFMFGGLEGVVDPHP